MQRSGAHSNFVVVSAYDVRCFETEIAPLYGQKLKQIWDVLHTQHYVPIKLELNRSAIALLSPGKTSFDFVRFTNRVPTTHQTAQFTLTRIALPRWREGGTDDIE